MVGTAAVATGGGSGVDFTEYRVNGGAWAKARTRRARARSRRRSASDEGEHTVDFRSADKAGNVEARKSVAFGIQAAEPGFPVIEAYADPVTGAAPLPVRFSASGFDPDGGRLSLPVGVRGRRRARLEHVAHVHHAGHVHGDGDGDRRRGRQDHAEVTVTVTAPGVLPPTVEATSSVTGGAARLSVAFTATGADPDGDAGAARVRVGLRRRRQVVRPEPDARVRRRRASSRPR